MQPSVPSYAVRRLGALTIVVTACGRIGFDATPTRDAIGGDDGPAVDAACFIASAPGRVAAYSFSDAAMLGRDSVGVNHLTHVDGNPQQSTDVPPGFPGHSLSLDGSSGLCLMTGWTFDSANDHTACWWSKQTTLPATNNTANQFAYTCGYDTWTANGGTTYRWTINNCNTGVSQILDVPNVFAAGTWVHICQTYERAALRRTVYINGDTANPHVLIDTDPIVMDSGFYWCLGSYYFDGSGGAAYWTGQIYAPVWFDRVLAPEEIAAIHSQTCTP